MIKKVLVKNFKCFEEFELPMKNINVLSGINGMGKSTIIQSLLVLRQSTQFGGSIKGLILNGNYTMLGNAQDVLYEKANEDLISLGYEDEQQRCFWTFKYLEKSDFLPIMGEEMNVVSTDLFGEQFSYLSAYRIQPQEMYRLRNEEDIERREFGNNGEYALQYLGIHGDDIIENKKVILEDKIGETLKNQTRLWLNRISPGVVPQITLDLSLRKSEVRYEFIEGREKTNSYKSINVGFGITYVLPLIITILSAKPGDIIIIENPEAHIHPAGQRMLGELIARAGAGGVQMIVETHSDHILNGIRLSVKQEYISADKVELSFFYKDEADRYRHKCVHPNILKDGRLDCWPEGFFDEWDKALYELI